MDCVTGVMGYRRHGPHDGVGNAERPTAPQQKIRHHRKIVILLRVVRVRCVCGVWWRVLTGGCIARVQWDGRVFLKETGEFENHIDTYDGKPLPFTMKRSYYLPPQEEFYIVHYSVSIPQSSKGPSTAEYLLLLLRSRVSCRAACRACRAHCVRVWVLVCSCSTMW